MSALDIETRRLVEDSMLQNETVLQLRLAKARTNLNSSLSQLSQPEVLQFEDRLLTTEFNILERKKRQNEELKSSLKIEPELERGELDELNMLASDMHLRRRSGNMSKLELDQLSHDKLSESLLDMTASIKQNAERFQQKLEADADLVNVATNSVQKTAANMSNVGQRLNQFRKQGSVGWMFYLLSTLFIVISFVLGMSLIQVFGKW